MICYTLILLLLQSYDPNLLIPLDARLKVWFEIVILYGKFCLIMCSKILSKH